jgi:hypothetical protein
MHNEQMIHTAGRWLPLLYSSNKLFDLMQADKPATPTMDNGAFRSRLKS